MTIPLRTRAIVLRRTNFGEADRIIHFLTPHGRVQAIARGVRREKSRLAAGVELFVECDIVVQRGKGELGVVSSAKPVRMYRHILEDYDRLQAGYTLLGRIAKSSLSLDEPEWFDVTTEVLVALDAGMSASLCELWELVRLAEILGDELNVYRDTSGKELEPTKQYRYDIHEKGFIEAQTGEIGQGHIKLLRLVRMKPLAVIVQVGGVAEVLPECLSVVRQHTESLVA